VYCFMSDFRAYRLVRGFDFPVAPHEFVSALRAWRGDVNCTALREVGLAVD